MMKQSIRAFGLGLLASAAALSFFDNISKEETMTNEEMIRLLEEQNYTVLTDDEMNEQPAIPESKEPATPAEEENIEPVESVTGKKEMTITIASGMSSADIVKALENAGVIEDAQSFNAYLKENKYASKLQIGTFTFSPNMSNEEIVSILIK
ncbi:hypothetical protein BTO30_05210 [Domibacillus antri]|uniref:Aminodeoxychorismate lyase n=1 Tax=Domibacillus antri TaxID=1714264 RepID=A0A1Q8Q7Q2_9BACI|nr:endolytic transglycosylase MltG [Domibacillus antri]OLN23363.1 hypothetical protein BTO30_05210 [Domibacillus antri]